MAGGDIALSLLTNIIAFLVAATVAPLIYSMSQFLVARVFGVTAKSVKIGMLGAVAAWKDRHGTKWKIGWLPVAGEVDVRLPLGTEVVAKRQFLESWRWEPRRRPDPNTRAHSIPLYKRALIVTAGPLANVLFAIAIFASFLMGSQQFVSPPVVGSVERNSAAEVAGIGPGDTIVNVDGVPMDQFDEFQTFVRAKPDQPIRIGLIRRGAELSIVATPRRHEAINIDGTRYVIGRLGISGQLASIDPIQAVGLALKQTWLVASGMINATVRAVFNEASQPSGPTGIINTDTSPLASFFMLLGWFAIGNALSIFLPIPGMDGPRLLHFAYQAIRGRPLGARTQHVAAWIAWGWNGLAVCAAALSMWEDIGGTPLF